MGSPVEPAVHGRLPYLPALDGLRGVAVVAVLLYHQGYPWARGGFLGVSLFFTLSGYLITTLVLREHASTGSLDLRGFWGRRLRRLAPAGLLGLGLGLVAIAFAVPAAQRAAAVVDVRAALVQVANWRFVLADAPYVDAGTVPSPVLHYWSLAIEEQFYLVLPVVALVTLRRSRRAFAVVLGATVVCSLALQVALPADDRIYFGTDTRAAELAVGALLALAWPTVSTHLRRSRLWDAVGAGALVITAVLWVGAEPSSVALLGGGLTAVGLLSVAVLAGTLGGRRVPGLLGVGPLRRLGTISYGLYVVHFPVFLLLSPERTGLEGSALFAVRAVVSIGIAAASLVLVERPVRERRPVLGLPLQGRLFPVTVVACLGVLALATVPLLRSAPSTTITPTGLLPAAIAGPSAAGDDSGGHGPRPPRLVLVGDSTAAALGEGLQTWAERTGALQVSVVSSPGCAVLAGRSAQYRPGFEFTPTGCDQLFPTAIVEAARVDADALVVLLGSPQLADWRFPGDPQLRSVDEPDVTARYHDALVATLARVPPMLPVLWADVPVPQWDLDSFGTLIGGEPPGTGPPVINQPRRTEVLNAATAAVLDATPGATTVAYADGLAGDDGVIAAEDRADGLHLSADQVADAAETWLLPALADAYDAAWDELGAAPDERIDWDAGRRPSTDG